MTIKAHIDLPEDIESKISIIQAVSIVHKIYNNLSQEHQIRPIACFIDPANQVPQHDDPDFLLIPTKPFQPEQFNPNRIPFDLWFIPWPSLNTIFEYSDSKISAVMTEHQIGSENDKLTYKSIFQLLSSLNRVNPLLIPKSGLKVFGQLTILNFDLDQNLNATYPYLQSIQIMFSEMPNSDANTLMVNMTAVKVDAASSSPSSKNLKKGRSPRKRRKK